MLSTPLFCHGATSGGSAMSDFTRLYHWIDGQKVAPSTDEKITLINPTTEAVLGYAPAGTAADVDLAVAAAVRAFETWGVTSVEERLVILERFADGIEKRGQELADVLTAEVGAPQHISLPAQVG